MDRDRAYNRAKGEQRDRDRVKNKIQDSGQRGAQVTEKSSPQDVHFARRALKQEDYDAMTSRESSKAKENIAKKVVGIQEALKLRVEAEEAQSAKALEFEGYSPKEQLVKAI